MTFGIVALSTYSILLYDAKVVISFRDKHEYSLISVKHVRPVEYSAIMSITITIITTRMCIGEIIGL